MSTSWRFLSILFLVHWCAGGTMAGIGTGELIDYSSRMPPARKNPVAVRESFYTHRSARDRSIVFELVLRLHSEKLVSKDDLRLMIDAAVTDVDETLRATATHYLHVVHDGETLHARYRRCTLDKSLLVRYAAAEHHREHPSEKSVPYLAALLSDESVEVRGCAAGALFNWKSIDVKGVFVEAAKDGDIRRAGCAAQVLYKGYGDTPNVELLNKYLDSELDKSPPFSSPSCTCGIIRCLAAIGSDSSVTVLKKAAAHKHRYVAEDASRALDKIAAPTGESR